MACSCSWKNICIKIWQTSPYCEEEDISRPHVQHLDRFCGSFRAIYGSSTMCQPPVQCAGSEKINWPKISLILVWMRWPKSQPGQAWTCNHAHWRMISIQLSAENYFRGWRHRVGTQTSVAPPPFYNVGRSNCSKIMVFEKLKILPLLPVLARRG